MTDAGHHDDRDAGSESSDLEEEMARDYECYPDSDDNNVRRGIHNQSNMTGGRMAGLSISAYSVNSPN